MELIVNKPQTYKGFSYCMKASYLKEALDSVNFDGFIHLEYWTPQGNNTIYCQLIHAEYWLPNLNVNYERFFIRTGVCQSQRRKELEVVMKNSVIPELVNWMLEVQNLPSNSSKKENRFFLAYYINNNLQITKC